MVARKEKDQCDEQSFDDRRRGALGGGRFCLDAVGADAGQRHHCDRCAAGDGPKFLKPMLALMMRPSAGWHGYFLPRVLTPSRLVSMVN